MRKILIFCCLIVSFAASSQNKKDLELQVANLTLELQKSKELLEAKKSELKEVRSEHEKCLERKNELLDKQNVLLVEKMKSLRIVDSLTNMLQSQTTGVIVNPKNQSDSIKMVLQQFYAAPGSEERYKFVYQDPLILEKMKNWYSNGAKTREIKSDDIAIGAKQGDMYTALYKNRIFYFFQSKDRYALDWESAVGYNDVALNTFKANSSIKDVTIRATVSILNYYNFNYEGKEAQFWSIRIVDSNYDEVYGYVSKTSELGKKIYNLISDGKEHSVIIEIRSDRSGDTTGNIVVITNLVSESWLR